MAVDFLVKSLHTKKYVTSFKEIELKKNLLNSLRDKILFHTNKIARNSYFKSFKNIIKFLDLFSLNKTLNTKFNFFLKFRVLTLKHAF